MSSPNDLLSVYVQAAFQKLSISDLFTNSGLLQSALVEGMPQFIWKVNTTANSSVHISAEMGNVKESWTLQLSLTKGRSVSRTLEGSPRPQAWKAEMPIEDYDDRHMLGEPR